MEDCAFVILAAGLGKRTRSEQAKVLLETAERKPLLSYVLNAIHEIGGKRVAVVVGYKRELVEQAASSLWKGQQSELHFGFQEKQFGTADAVKAARPALSDFTGTVVILCGDVPLLQSKTIENLLRLHEESKATVSLLSFVHAEDSGYGRIVRDSEQKFVLRIVERKDCTVAEVAIQECNAGVYAIDSAFLWAALDLVKNDNAAGEFYLTDIVGEASRQGQRVTAYLTADATETAGVNDLVDLNEISTILRKRRVDSLIRNGITFIDAASVVIDPDVTIGEGCHIGPNVQLRGSTSLGSGSVIDGNAIITDCQIGSGCRLKLGIVADNAIMDANVSVGPFAHIRPGTNLARNVRIGNFVETKNATMAEGSKANHLTYLGDCSVGINTNIGAGTITCNYDGYDKHFTEIGAEVFIGSNTALIAPVQIGDGAMVAAGSTITENVEADALAVARSSQQNKPGWAKKKREHSRKS